MAAARELVIADEPAAWAALGFSVGDDGALTLGGVRIRLAGAAAGRGIVAVRADGLAAERPDGLPIRGHVLQSSAGARSQDLTPVAHANGALAIDHVVILTDDRDRTTAALEAGGGDVRRRGEPPELPAPMAFVRFGELILEVAQAGGPARFWGVTVRVPDVDALGVGMPRAAVQPGRRIVTVTRAAGLSVALAFITPP
jgi:hypothetical protein